MIQVYYENWTEGRLRQEAVLSNGSVDFDLDLGLDFGGNYDDSFDNDLGGGLDVSDGLDVGDGGEFASSGDDTNDSANGSDNDGPNLAAISAILQPELEANGDSDEKDDDDAGQKKGKVSYMLKRLQ